jgi:hypothetical protein
MPELNGESNICGKMVKMSIRICTFYHRHFGCPNERARRGLAARARREDGRGAAAGT